MKERAKRTKPVGQIPQAPTHAESGAVLHVHRDAAKDTRFRTIQLTLDGIFVGRLKFSESMSVPLNPGRHVLCVDNTWAKRRIVLDVEDGAEYAAQVGSLPVPFYGAMMAVLNTSPMRVFIQVVRVSGLEEEFSKKP